MGTPFVQYHLCRPLCVPELGGLQKCYTGTSVNEEKKIAILKELQGEIIGYILIINWTKCLIQKDSHFHAISRLMSLW